MRVFRSLGSALLMALAIAPNAGARGDDTKPPAKPAAPEPEPKRPAAAPDPSFMRDVAPVLVRNCIACHNPKKSESKYIMTTFAQLAKGGKQGEGTTVVAGKPDDSYIIDVLLEEAEPRMPYKLDPLPPGEIDLLKRWIAQGAKYDGTKPEEDWTFLLRRMQHVTVPESYPVTVPITALEFSPDGATLWASGYHELTAWKVADGALERRLPGLAERTYALSIRLDGKWLATASGDPGLYGLARLWAADSGALWKPVRELGESQDVVFAAAFSPDGKSLAVAGADRAVRVFETETGKLSTQIEDHADWIFDVAFSPDGKRLATASRDKTSKVFDLEKKESLVTFTGHAQPVYTVAFAPDGKTVTTGGEDNSIRIWSLDGEAKQVKEIGGFGGTVFKLRHTPDGKTLVACSGDRSVKLFKVPNGSLIRSLAGHKDWVYTVAVSADNRLVASGGWDGEVKIWNIADGKELRTIIAAPGFKPGAKQAAR